MTYTFIEDQNAQHLGGNVGEGDPYTHCPAIWAYMIERFSAKSVLDVGSGMGYAAAYFHSKGMATLAVEGLPFNALNAVYPTVVHDLTHCPVVCKVDLVHCQEVVEHIDEIYLDNLMKTLTCGKFIIMTHAFPGQGGHHHVNEQPSEYWVNVFKQYNCELLVEDSNRIRGFAGRGRALFLARSGMVFVNKNRK